MALIVRFFTERRNCQIIVCQGFLEGGVAGQPGNEVVPKDSLRFFSFFPCSS